MITPDNDLIFTDNLVDFTDTNLEDIEFAFANGCTGVISTTAVVITAILGLGVAAIRKKQK